MYAEQSLPEFSQLRPADYPAQCEELLNRSRADVAGLLASDTPPSWQSLMQPLEEINDRIEQFWAPLSHLHAVISGDAWRDAYNKCLPLLRLTAVRWVRIAPFMSA